MGRSVGVIFVVCLIGLLAAMFVWEFLSLRSFRSILHVAVFVPAIFGFVPDSVAMFAFNFVPEETIVGAMISLFTQLASWLIVVAIATCLIIGQDLVKQGFLSAVVIGVVGIICSSVVCESIRDCSLGSPYTGVVFICDEADYRVHCDRLIIHACGGFNLTGI